MNSTDIKDYVVAILTKSKRLDEVPLEHIEEVERVVALMKAKFISPKQQKLNRQKASQSSNADAKSAAGIAGHDSVSVSREDVHAAMDDKNHRLHHLTHPPSDLHPSEHNGSDHEEAATTAIENHLSREKAAGKELPIQKPKPSSSHLKVIKEEAGGGGIAGMPDDGAGAGVVKFEEEVVKIDDKGQWSIEKAIKPGPTLNYKEINKPVNTEDNPANTINYKEMNRPKHMDKPKNTIDYKQVNSANPDAENAAREAKHKAKQNTMVGGSPEKDAAQAELARRRAAIRSSGSGTPVKPAMETIKERADKKKT